MEPPLKQQKSESDHSRTCVSDGISTNDTVFIVKDYLRGHDLHFLETECNNLRVIYNDQDPLERAAALDPFEYVNIHPTSPIRTNQEQYLRARQNAISAMKRSNGTEQVSTDSYSTIDELLFGKLPMLVRIVCGLSPSTHLYLFNEHYVVKEPQSDLAFRWHRDSDEQMPFIPFSKRMSYFSCWCALDDVDESNGSLVVAQGGNIVEFLESDFHCPQQVKNRSNPISKFGPSSNYIYDDNNGVLIKSSKGTVVIFSGNKWHCSGPNDSILPRRVFYAQYSLEPICIGENEPLLFAIDTR